ncbi:CpsD/CapB family tyrosine-protein kinase [Pseudoalteromonas sp. SSM20]|uniref:CpsD/CapB family tyrosine-protein kinase n=1 Tax=Pseudoalteromonas sp. SSM20 TaxID=3139394 RepID=UPI003BAD482C
MSSNYISLADSFKNELTLLESNLMEASDGERVQSILVTSSKSGEGKTLSAISLSRKLALENNYKVLLIDSNIQSPQLHEIFELPLQPGLSECLNDSVNIKQACHTSDNSNLDIMPLGRPKGHISQIIKDNKLNNLITELKSQYDYIIVDTTYVLGTSEVSLICGVFDAILLVVECEATKWQVVKTAADKLTSSHGKLIGTILNRRQFYIPQIFYG